VSEILLRQVLCASAEANDIAPQHGREREMLSEVGGGRQSVSQFDRICSQNRGRRSVMLPLFCYLPLHSNIYMPFVCCLYVFRYWIVLEHSFQTK
jgi:hypothetical protein